MIISHVKPVGWVDTNEPGLIQPSEVAGLVHMVTLEVGDLVQGPQGLPGADGEPGAAGAQGPQGLPGADGAPGAAGAKGLQGLKGDAGAQGAQGLKGDAGAAGAQGPQGLKGAAGAQGPQGLKGDTGAAGAKGIAPAGAVLYFAMGVAPAGWLACNGALVSRTTYALLFAAIGTLYGVGDGSTTFALPDLRGEFLRGVDGGRGVDTGRELGSWQDNQNKMHRHEIGSGINTGPKLRGGASNAANDAAVFNYAGTGGVVEYQMYIWDSGGNESRPRNVALLACISTGL